MTVSSSADCDLISSFLNLGPLGTKLPVQLRIPHGLRPGSILFITARCENRLCISFKDDVNCVVQNLQIRVTKNDITITDQCVESKGVDETLKTRFSLACICEPEGYRIFINGRQTEFFKQNYVETITFVDVSNCQVYKIVYTTIVFNDESKGSTKIPVINENKDNGSDNEKKEVVTPDNKNNENNNENVRVYSLPPAE